MAEPSQNPWSDNSNAPKIPYRIHLAEEFNFIGDFVAAIFYGIIVILFFQCIHSLLDPSGRRAGSIKWGLVAHTVAMFSCVTVTTTAGLSFQSVSYINNREFSGVDVGLPPGPIGYKNFASTTADFVIPVVMFQMNQWLADGLLLYRCYIIYTQNYSAIALPFLMYLSSFVIGVVYTYSGVSPKGHTLPAAIGKGLPYYWISLSLNVLLTLMIVARLVLHSRYVRKATGVSPGAGLYTTIITILVESCALYAVGFLLFIGTWSGSNEAFYIFWPTLNETQVIASFLIIKRIADRRALTSDTTTPANVGSLQFRAQGATTDGDETALDEYCMDSMSTTCGDSPGGYWAEDEDPKNLESIDY